MTDLTVANTILQQLGGRRFVVMTGAKNFLGGDTSLTFGIPRGAKNKANKVKVTLTDRDDYTVEFYRFAKLELHSLDKIEGVYAENLQEVFTDRTGFYTRF